MRDTRSLLLLLLSVGLVGTWIYHLYDKTNYSHRKTQVYIRDSTAIADGIRDSLNKLYSSEINELGKRIYFSENGTDSYKGNIDDKLNELGQLKNEITGILKSRDITKNDLLIARKKIEELRSKVDELKIDNVSILQETNRLNTILQQLNTEIKDLQKSVSKMNADNQLLSERINLASLFVATEISLNAITVKKQQESETATARKTNKLVASFLLQNQAYDFSNTEVFAIVIQPDGQVLTTDDSGAATFETKAEGVLSFTKKIKLDYIKGEKRKIVFPMQTNDMKKGNYRLQIWHKGIMIGEATRRLA
jgi:hypothetical protein